MKLMQIATFVTPPTTSNNNNNGSAAKLPNNNKNGRDPPIFLLSCIIYLCRGVLGVM